MERREITRRGWLHALLGAAGAGLAARALGACGGADVSVRIRRTDGTRVGSQVIVRASIVVTNHTNVAQSLPLRLTLADSAGNIVGSLNETVAVAPAELICRCENVTVNSAAFGAGGLRIAIELGSESVTTSLDAVGATPLPSCDYTCNY